MPKPTAASFCRKAIASMLALALLWGSVFSALASDVDAVQVAAAPLSTQTSATNGMVRVYLSSLGNPSRLDLTIAGNYSLSTTGAFLTNGSTASVGFNSSTGNLTFTYNGVTTNMGKSFSLRRHSATGTNGIKISQARESGNPYPGDLSFEAVASGSGYTLYTIAHIYIENYLYGVLPYEMGNSTHIEALKAQAVAARTYTVRMMQSRASGRYDVKDTTSDQVYRGTPSGNANCVAAVDATKGIVLMYGSSYITTYYSASNGGQTEIPRTGGSYGYMTVKDDPFDYANTSSTVKKKTLYADLTSSQNPSGLVSLLKSKAVTVLSGMGYAATTSNTTLQTLQAVTPHTPMYASPSRLYTKMDFTMRVETLTSAGVRTQTTVTVTCDIFDELESLLSMSIQSMDNELWSVQKSADTFSLQARRYGHGMGMSQRGAMYMAKLGYTYDEILGFYYEGCTRVRHSFTNTILSAGSSETQTTVEDAAQIEDDNDDACRGTVRLTGTGATLAIRAEKSTTAATVGSAANGAIVEVLSDDGTWLYIAFGNIRGYVPKSAVSYTGTPSGSDGQATSILGFATVTASDFVNLRAAGSMSATVLTTAPAGAVLTVFSREGSWAYVQYNATVAYVNTNYISTISATYPGNTVNGSSVATVVTSDGTGTVNLRAYASTSASVLAKLSHGTQVTVLSDDGSWSLIRYGEETGYMMSSFLTYTGEAGVPDGNEELPPDGDAPQEDDAPDGEEAPNDGEQPLTARVTTEYGSLNMRAEARAGSPILTTIPRGALVTVTQAGSIWCGVSYNGYQGYSMTCYLTFEEGEQGGETDTPVQMTAIVTTVSGSLNLRALPRSGSDILLRIPQYATVNVTEYGSQWCGVNYNGVSGYVMTMFLTLQPTQPDVGDATPSPSPSPDASEPSQSPEATPDATPAPDAQKLYAVVTTASGSLNLRQQGSTSSSVLTLIPRGTSIEVLERFETWSRVSYAGMTGFVMNQFLTFTQESAPSEGASLRATVTTVSGSLNLRSGPSLNDGVMTRIPQGAVIDVQERGDTWCVVRYGGMSGYVMTQYLTFHGNASATAQPSQSPDPTDPDATTAAPDATPTALVAYVNTSSGSLNLRAEPSTAAAVLTTIPRGATVSVTLRGESWSSVTYGAYSGYVMDSYLWYAPVDPGTPTPPSSPEPSATPAPQESTTVWVVTPSGSLNLRDAPGGNVIGAIPRLAAMQLLGRSGSWCLVMYQGTTGYVSDEFVSLTDPSATPSPSPQPSSSPESAEPSATDQTSEPSPSPSPQEATEPPTQSPTTPSPSAEPQSYLVTQNGVTMDSTLATPDTPTSAILSPAGQGDALLWPQCLAEGEPILRAPAGGEVTVLLKGKLWCFVEYDGTQGYCPTDDLEFLP